MKKTIIFVLLLTSSVPLSVLAQEDSATVPARAHITGFSNLFLRVLDPGGSEKTGASREVDFGDISSIFHAAPDYLGVRVESNYGVWMIDVYSDNFAGTTAPTEEPFDTLQYGGLINTDGSSRLPLAWCAFDSPYTETPGNPGEVRTITAGGVDHEVPATRWTWLKDKADREIPGEGVGDWTEAQAGGYALAAFGLNNEWGWITNPLLFEMDGDSYVIEDGELVSANDPLTIEDGIVSEFYIYLETAAPADPGTYEGTVGVDLYYE